MKMTDTMVWDRGQSRTISKMLTWNFLCLQAQNLHTLLAAHLLVTLPLHCFIWFLTFGQSKLCHTKLFRIKNAYLHKANTTVFAILAIVKQVYNFVSSITNG